MPVERFHLNASQKRKLEVGDSVQINRKNMEGPNEKERYGVDIDLTEGKGFPNKPTISLQGIRVFRQCKRLCKKTRW